jgi:hypothetical protein
VGKEANYNIDKILDACDEALGGIGGGSKMGVMLAQTWDPDT